MKRIALAAVTAALLATSATAGGITFSLPNLTFPPASDTTVMKDCLVTDATTVDCIPQE